MAACCFKNKSFLYSMNVIGKFDMYIWYVFKSKKIKNKNPQSNVKDHIHYFYWSSKCSEKVVFVTEYQLEFYWQNNPIGSFYNTIMLYRK